MLTKMSSATESSVLEEQIQKLQKPFGAIVSTVKHLKAKIEDLEEKLVENKLNEVKEVLETQRVIDEVVVANSDAIRHIKTEIIQIKSEKYTDRSDQTIGVDKNEKSVKKMFEKQEKLEGTISKNAKSIKVIDDDIKKILIDKKEKDASKQAIEAAIKQLNQEISKIKEAEGENSEEGQIVSDKMKNLKCRYFNSGYCKYKKRCKFLHPKNICKETKCDKEKCPNRHPKPCKWYKGETGCRRGKDCDFSHDTLVCGDKNMENQPKYFNCVSCKHTWNETKFVIKHNIKGMEVYFCLNCEDWVKLKDNVFDQGWSLFDQDGNLNHFV